MPNSMRTNLKLHNSGRGSTSIMPMWLWPYAICAYMQLWPHMWFNGICGNALENKKRSAYFKWGKQSKKWARSGNCMINDMGADFFGSIVSKLKLICCYKE